MLVIVVGLTISYVIQISEKGVKNLEIKYLEYLKDTILR